MGNVTIKKQGLGSPVSKVYNENRVVTVLEKKIYLKGPMSLQIKFLCAP